MINYWLWWGSFTFNLPLYLKRLIVRFFLLFFCALIFYLSITLIVNTKPILAWLKVNVNYSWVWRISIWFILRLKVYRILFDISNRRRFNIIPIKVILPKHEKIRCRMWWSWSKYFLHLELLREKWTTRNGSGLRRIFLEWLYLMMFFKSLSDFWYERC